MFTSPRALVLSALAAASLTSHASAFLLVNGGFEVGAVPMPNGNVPAPWTSTAPGNVFVSYDTWANGGVGGIPPAFAGLFTGATAPQGTRWAGGFTFEEMGQLLGAPLTPGQQYGVSAIVRPGNTQPPASFEFYIGTGPGSPVSLLATFPMVAPGVWTPQGAIFTAPANALANPWFIIKAYSFSATGALQTAYVGIDDVVLRPVPTPGAAALVGLSGLAFFRRRRA